MDIVEIKGKINISYNKETNAKKIKASIYLDNVLDTEIFMDTDIHKEGDSKDILEAYIYRLDTIINLNNGGNN